MSSQHTILIYTITFKPLLGGSEIAIDEVIKRLSDFRFLIVTARLDRKLPKYEKLYENVEVFRIGPPGFNIISKNLYVLFAFFWGLRYAVKNDVKIVWAVLESYGAMAAALLKLVIHDVFYIMTMQDGSSELFWQKRVGWWKFLFKRVYHLADHITAISNYLVRRARNIYSYTGPVTLVPNATSDHFFIPISHERRLEIRKQWGVGDSDRVILSDSRLVEKNGVDTLIEAFGMLHDSNYSSSEVEKYKSEGSPRWSNSKLVIIGDGNLRNDLELRVTRYGLGDSVIFMGTVPHETIHEYYQATDVFCRPSRSEGFGNSFVQAMASRLVTVGTNVGGIVDFLRHGENGYVVSPDQPESLARILELALKDSEENEMIQERAYVTASQYRWDRVAQQYRTVFLEVEETLSVKKYLLFRQFVKYLIVGGTATGVDFVLFTIFVELLGLYYLLANGIGFVGGFLTNFTLSRRWTFRVQDRPVGKQFLAYTAAAGVYLLLSSLVLAGFVEVVGLHRVTAKVATVAVMVVWNFLIARYVVFKYF